MGGLSPARPISPKPSPKPQPKPKPKPQPKPKPKPGPVHPHIDPPPFHILTPSHPVKPTPTPKPSPKTNPCIKLDCGLQCPSDDSKLKGLCSKCCTPGSMCAQQRCCNFDCDYMKKNFPNDPRLQTCMKCVSAMGTDVPF